jgi:hypothetical protein
LRPLSFWLSHQNPVYISLIPIHAICSANLILWGLPNHTWQGVQVMKLLIMQFSPTSLFGPDILLSTLFSNTISVCSSLNVTDQVSNTYKTRGKL